MMTTKIVLAIAFVLLGFWVPHFVGNRGTTTWMLWFIGRILPGLCFGAAIGLVITVIRKG